LFPVVMGVGAMALGAAYFLADEHCLKDVRACTQW